MIFITTLTLLIASIIASEEPALETARIIASKFPQSMYAVENMDLVVEYKLYNAGDKTAYKVHLNDVQSFPTNSFEIIKGQLSARWERIAPGSNVTHAVVVRPKAVGVFNYTSAHITYTNAENSNDYRLGYTNAPGEGYIYQLKDYERRFAPKLNFWIGFVAILLPFTLGSYYMYISSVKKYEEFLKKDEKKEKTEKKEL